MTNVNEAFCPTCLEAVYVDHSRNGAVKCRNCGHEFVPSTLITKAVNDNDAVLTKPIMPDKSWELLKPVQDERARRVPLEILCPKCSQPMLFDNTLPALSPMYHCFTEDCIIANIEVLLRTDLIDDEDEGDDETGKPYS